MYTSVQRFIPGDGLKLSSAAFGLAHRTWQAIGIVENLQSGLSARTQLALVKGVLRVAFNLERSPIHDTDENAAARRALPAGAGIPGRLPGQLFFRRAHVRFQGYPAARRLAARQHGGRGGGRAELEEFATCDGVRHVASY